MHHHKQQDTGRSRSAQEAAHVIAYDKKVLLGLIKLSRIPGLGDQGIARILAVNREHKLSLTHFFDSPLNQLRQEYRLTARITEYIHRHKQQIEEEAQELFEHIAHWPIGTVIPGEADYPKALDAWYGRTVPPLYLYGNRYLLSSSKAAIVNSATITKAGLGCTLALAQRLSESTIHLISSSENLSYNLVSAASKNLDCPLVVVLSEGVLKAFEDGLYKDPVPLARRLKDNIDLNRTLFISPFRLDGVWQKGNGPRRDELIIALADRIVGLEIRKGGRMERLLKKASGLGKEVFIAQFAEYSAPTSANPDLIDGGAIPLPVDEAGTNYGLILGGRAMLETPSTKQPAEAGFARRQVLGQFFTPPEVAHFMWEMVETFRGSGLEESCKAIDPAVGEGAFLAAALERKMLPGHNLYGVDIDESLLLVWKASGLFEKAHLFRYNGLLDNPSISLVPNAFDVVIGNPPFGGVGLEEVARLVENSSPETENIGQSSPTLFEMHVEDNQLPKHTKRKLSPLTTAERAVLSHLTYQIIRNYQSWQKVLAGALADDEDSDQPLLFGGISTAKPGARDYDRLMEIIERINGQVLLDPFHPQMKSIILRLATFPIEILFAERFVQLCRPGGYIAVILPDGIFASMQTQYFRDWLLEQGQVLAIISLPRRVFTGVGANAKTSILFFRKYTGRERKRVLVEKEENPEACYPHPSVMEKKVVMASMDYTEQEVKLTEYLNHIVKTVKAIH